MRDWPAVTSGEIPSPKLVAAWITLGIVPTERVPLWAAHWLVDGYDGEALRALAGFSGTDPYEVHDTLLDALANCGTPIPDSASAAAQVTFTQLAYMHAAGTADEKWIMDKVDEVVARSDYATSVISLPLGQIYTLSDEWGTGWGRTEQQLKAEVQAACTAQLARPLHAAPGPDETARD